jgi:type III secretory pathway component EscV
MTTLATVGGTVLFLVVVILAAIRVAKGSGRAEAERARFRAKSEQARQANEIDEDVAGLSVDELSRELRDRR